MQPLSSGGTILGGTNYLQPIAANYHNQPVTRIIWFVCDAKTNQYRTCGTSAVEQVPA